MSSTPEYNLRDLGPWELEADGLWCAPDPVSNGATHVWWSEGARKYTDCSGIPIYFAGTDPRRPGLPPPEDEADVGTPREQWEAEVRMSDRDAWYAYSKNWRVGNCASWASQPVSNMS